MRLRVGDLSGGEKPAPWVGGRHRRRPHARRARPSGRTASASSSPSRVARRSVASTSSSIGRTRRVARIQLFAPRQICAQQDPVTGNCVAATASACAGDSTKEERSRPIRRSSRRWRRRSSAFISSRRQRSACPLMSRFVESATLGSPLGNLFADALRDAVPGADVAVVNNAARGLRADLPDGPITFGRLYDVFPFDNRVVRITLTGAELGRWLAGEIRQGRRGCAWHFRRRRAGQLPGGRHSRRSASRGGAADSRRRSVARRDDRRADAQRQPGVASSTGRRRANRECPGRAGSGRGLVSAHGKPAQGQLDAATFRRPDDGDTHAVGCGLPRAGLQNPPTAAVAALKDRPATIL